MWATLGTQGFKGGPPIELLNNSRIKLRKHAFIAIFFLGTRIEFEGKNL
jgi:hypothetical protein